MSNKFVITIGREYGSGGREVARKLAELLGVKCYDKELIDLAAEKKGLDKSILEKHDEKKGGLFPEKRTTSLPAFDSFGKNANDRVFLIQSQVIRELAESESCIIVGRCADHILKDHENVLSVFISAPMEARVERITSLYELPTREAEAQIAHFDKERSSYYAYYTDKLWGGRDSCDLVINSKLLGVEGTAKLIKYLAEQKFA